MDTYWEIKPTRHHGAPCVEIIERPSGDVLYRFPGKLIDLAAQTVRDHYAGQFEAVTRQIADLESRLQHAVTESVRGALEVERGQLLQRLDVWSARLAELDEQAPVRAEWLQNLSNPFRAFGGR